MLNWTSAASEEMFVKVQVTSSPDATSMLEGLDPSEQDVVAGSQPAGVSWLTE